MLLRLVTRLAHSRSQVKLAPPRAQNKPHYVDDPARFTLIPANARRAYAQLIDKQTALQAYSEAQPVNALTIVGHDKPGILVSGLAWNYLNEALGDAIHNYNLLRIGTYPLPVKKIRQLLDVCSEVFVVEEGYPFIERYISALGLMTERRIRGKLTGDLPRIGELSEDAPSGPVLTLRSSRLCNWTVWLTCWWLAHHGCVTSARTAMPILPSRK